MRPKPIAILRSSNNAYGSSGNERSFGYSYETENGISQESSGELRQVGKEEVMVMRGSYSFTGSDNQVYVVDWYADETGFHPSAPHLPVAPAIPFPEQAAAVEAQIRFAAENPEPVRPRQGREEYVEPQQQQFTNFQGNNAFFN